jgi:lactoylglutathione lyase
MGDAWGHLAVRTDDLEGYWSQLMEREAEDYRDPESCGFDYAFTKDADGHEIEIVTP